MLRVFRLVLPGLVAVCVCGSEEGGKGKERRGYEEDKKGRYRETWMEEREGYIRR